MRPSIEQFLLSCLSRGTYVCLAAALVFAPLAFGGVEPWACAIIAVLAYSALAFALARAAVSGEFRRLLSPMLVPAAVAVALVGVQCLPWPAGLLGAFSSKTLELHQAAGGAADGGATACAPSLYPHATWSAFLLLTAYVALFVATCDYVRSRQELARIAAVILCAGFAVALLGIAQRLSGTHKLYWWREPTHGGLLFGPFVSRNQYASYAGVCLFTGLGLLVARGAGAARSLRHWREGMERSVTGPAHKNFTIAFAVGLIGASVFVSLSRGGILSMLLAFAAVFAAMGLASVGRRRGRYVAAVVIAILGWVTYLGWEPVVRRFSSLGDSLLHLRAGWRWQMLGDAWRMGWQFPLLGTGAGTFRSVYPSFCTLPTRALTDSPHNEYFHVFAEMGLPGVLTLGAAVVLFYATVIRGLRRRRNPYVRGFLAGGLGAPVVVTLHSAVDFPMRSPAVAATMAVCAGLLCRASMIESNKNRQPPSEADAAWALPAGLGEPGAEESANPGAADPPASTTEAPLLPNSLERWLVVVVLVGLAWMLSCDAALNLLRGQLEGQLIRRAGRQGATSGESALAFVAASELSLSQHSPGDAELRAALSDFALAAAPAAGPLRSLELAEKSLELCREAGRLEPMNADYPFRTAVRYASLGRPDLGWVYAEKACRLLPNDPWIRAGLAGAFGAYGVGELAEGYLRDAERLADERGIEAVRPLIADVRGQLKGRAGPP
ncbi:MAG: hypothetical protein AMK73_03470 [Planctomycetes bacterium SM23_32]|nr:MAG: hypothetical protein AMK73_03470 [Planctomycetes bacterium SM23_32]